MSLASPPVPPLSGIAPLTFKQQLTDWLLHYLHLVLDLPLDVLDASKSLLDYGLDSVSELELIGILETWLGGQLSPYLLYQYPSIASFADALVHLFLDRRS